MKILFYGINFSPELTGIGKYTGEMASWFDENGHDVVVITAPPYYPNWKVLNGYTSWLYKRERFGNATVWRSPLYVPRKPTGLKRIFHLLSFALFSIPIFFMYFREKRPDIIFSIEPPLFTAPIALVFSKITGAKSWLHVQDFEVDAALELGILPYANLRKGLLRTEASLLSRFHVVSTISKSMMKKLEQKSVRPEATYYFPNWSQLEKISPNAECGIRFRLDNEIDEEHFIALYSGNVGEKQGLDAVIDAAKILTDYKKIQILICGEGAKKNELENRVLSEGILNVKFLPLQPLKKLEGLLNSADTHLVIQRAGAADLVMPSKLTNIISAGGYSVITADKDTELGNLLRDYPYIGTLVDPESPEKLAESIFNIYSGNLKPDKRLIRSYAEQSFGYAEVMASLEGRFNDLLFH